MNYYKTNFQEFINNTFNCDMSEQYRFFEKHLQNKGVILDIGFGSGRDSLYFINKGYEVYSIDPEEEFVKRGQSLGLNNVYQLKAEDINFENMFNGIWACASLLHVPSNKLNSTLIKCCNALKSDGVMYISFKYGEFEGERNGRFYLDLTEESLAKHLTNTGLKIKETSVTKDNRKDNQDIWLNAILVKE